MRTEEEVDGGELRARMYSARNRTCANKEIETEEVEGIKIRGGGGLLMNPVMPVRGGGGGWGGGGGVGGGGGGGGGRGGGVYFYTVLYSVFFFFFVFFHHESFLRFDLDGSSTVDRVPDLLGSSAAATSARLEPERHHMPGWARQCRWRAAGIPKKDLPGAQENCPVPPPSRSHLPWGKEGPVGQADRRLPRNERLSRRTSKFESECCVVFGTLECSNRMPVFWGPFRLPKSWWGQ